jgi:hypothetical protein
MIRVDYVIERDEGDEIKTYKPNLLGDTFDNVSYIKAPNATGKSTLLNLIAVAFFGNRLPSQEIDPTLRTRIASLQDLNHQKVVFDINIENPEMGVTLISKKNNPNTLDTRVSILLDGKERLLNYDSFTKDFCLIYDIPYNPLERLKHLLTDIKSSQINIIGKTDSLKNKVMELISDIRASRDPQKLQEIIDKKQMLEAQRDNFDKEQKILSEHKEKVNAFFLSKFYVESINNLKYLKSERENLFAQLEIAKKDGRTIARKINNLSSKIEENKEKTRRLFNIAVSKIATASFPKEEIDHFNAFKDASLIREINYPDVSRTIRNEINFFSVLFRSLLENDTLAFNKDIDKLFFFRVLLQTLSDIHYNDITLPGINQPVAFLKEKLSEEIDRYKPLEDRLKVFQECIECLENLSTSLANTTRIVQEYGNLSRQDTTQDYLDLQETNLKIKDFDENIRLLDKKIDSIRQKLIINHLDPSKTVELMLKYGLDPDVKSLETLSEAKFQEYISQIDFQLAKKAIQGKRIIETIRDYENQIILLNSQKPHSYRPFLRSIEQFFQRIQQLELLFRQEYSVYLKHIDENGRLTNDEINYASLLGKLIAKRLEKVIYGEQEYVVDDVNILENTILTETGKIITYNDFSTGQSQAAYLKAKLSMEKNRKIIALFDEVAAMDEKSLEPVKLKLKELYLSKRLLMAIIVQKSDEVSKESLL